MFFESSHRIGAAIADMTEVFGEQRQVAVCRELTKKFETVFRVPLSEMQKELAQDTNQSRGEFVVIVDGYQGSEEAALSEA